MLDRDMRNVVIFPERIDGRYVGLFRPNDTRPGDAAAPSHRSASATTEDFRTGPWKIDDEPIMRTGAARARSPTRSAPARPGHAPATAG